MKFLILDGYPKPSRDQFDAVGMTLAGQLYANLLQQHLPDSNYDILYTSDSGVVIPTQDEIAQYTGILWPGCNLTVYHTQDERVQRMISITNMAFETSVPQFGSCWAAQIAVYVAGGEVKLHPRGREMGVARKIYLTDKGKAHPMYEGKPTVFDGFISHDDEITRLPDGAHCLASNDFTSVQAVSVQYKNGIFWATQYHPEYNLHEVARLILAREEKLTRACYFSSHQDVVQYVNDLEAIAKNHTRKDLRWKYAIDEDLLDDAIRQREFVNWLNNQVSVTTKPQFVEGRS